MQIFFRGKTGIRKLNEMIASVKKPPSCEIKRISAVILFHDLEKLRQQKDELEAKQGLISFDADLTIAIAAVDNEIKRVQRKLRKISRRSRFAKR